MEHSSSDNFSQPPTTVALPVFGQGRVFRIGRDKNADLVLSNAGVSRNHAEIRITESGPKINDLNSRYGTRVNGVMITECVLAQGDRIEFGPIIYEILAGSLRCVQQVDGFSLKVQGLSLSHGNKKLLHDASFNIHPNEFVGILGASGSGKTTLIKCLATFITQNEGEVWFDKQNVTEDLKRYRSLLGYVPQDDAVLKTLSVRSNLEYAQMLRGPAGQSASERMHEVDLALSRVSLKESVDKIVNVLSGGQRKRLGIAMEILARPRILFLDEPTAGLDPATENRVMATLKTIAGTGTTTLCSTHVLANLNLFDKVIVLAGKRVAYVGPPSKIMSAFGVADIVSLYEKLETFTSNSNTKNISISPSNQADHHDYLKQDESQQTVPPQTLRKSNKNDYAETRRISLDRQLCILISRSFALLAADYRAIFLVALQPVIIGLFINLAQSNPYPFTAIHFFSIITVIWLGFNNSAREIVKEKIIYNRERFLGVTSSGYLISKIGFLMTLGVFQIFELLIVTRLLSFVGHNYQMDWISPSFAFMFVVLMLVYASAIALGLTISAVSKTEEQAVLFLPLLILPQLLISKIASNHSSDPILGPLASLFTTTSDSSRNICSWFMEVAAIFLYSRPAYALLLKPAENVDPTWSQLIDWGHLLLLCFGTLLFAAWYFNRDADSRSHKKHGSLILKGKASS
jgi:ABC-type multidrug transport system ATPase subunit